MVQLYVTKWVLARGIVVLPAVKRERDRNHKEWYCLQLPERQSRRMSQVALGTGAFLTLEEAQEDALWRYRKAAEDIAAAAQRIAKGLQLAEDLQLQVHHAPSNLDDCSPY